MASRLGTYLRRGPVVLLLGAAVGALVLSLGFSLKWSSRPLPYRQGQTTFPSPYHPDGHVVAVEVDGGKLSIIHTFPLGKMPDIMLPLGWWPEVVRSSDRALGPFSHRRSVVRCRVMASSLDLLTRRVTWMQLRALGVSFEHRDVQCPLWALAVLCCVYPTLYLVGDPSGDIGAAGEDCASAAAMT